MSPPNLQGLNVVHPIQAQNPYLTDTQDLLTASHFPELNAQLDLWTNLAFESDEPLVRPDDGKKDVSAADEVEHEEEEEEEEAAGPAATDAHANVVTGHPVTNGPASASGTAAPAFDLQSILLGFGVDPFNPPAPAPTPTPTPAATATPSLAQILALYPAQAQAYTQLQLPAGGFPMTQGPTGESASTPRQAPAAKRARTRKASISVSTAGTDDGATPAPESGLSPAEDKRRRNTAASARFRLKKKEREAALERKAKELETRVVELERECEGLRRENGWLKGLVVGVTGASAAQHQQHAHQGQSAGKRAREGEGK